MIKSAELKCPKCKVWLKRGVCLDTVDSENIRYEYTPYSKGVLLSCWKCTECGHSESNDVLSTSLYEKKEN